MSDIRAESSPLKPQYFVTRQNGAMVPLIAMDELPHHVQIKNLSRSLSAWDTAGMTGVGVASSRHEHYVVGGMNNTKPVIVELPQPKQPSVETITLPIRPVPILAKPKAKSSRDWKGPVRESIMEEGRAYGVEDQAASEVDTPVSQLSLIDFDVPIDSPTPTNTSATTSLGSNTTKVARTHGKKTHCAYWMRKGECDFAQTGCIYKHEMPTDLAGLHAVGLQDLPKWYRERYGKGSMLVGGGNSKLSHGIHDLNWRRGARAEEVSRTPSRQSVSSQRYSTASASSSSRFHQKRKGESHVTQDLVDEYVEVVNDEDDQLSSPAQAKQELIRRHEEALSAAAMKRDEEGFRKGHLQSMTGWAHASLRPVYSRRGRAARPRREAKDGKNDAIGKLASGSALSGSSTQGKPGFVEREAKGVSIGSSK